MHTLWGEAACSSTLSTAATLIVHLRPRPSSDADGAVAVVHMRYESLTDDFLGAIKKRSVWCKGGCFCPPPSHLSHILFFFFDQRKVTAINAM